jgi:hypothetical protein
MINLTTLTAVFSQGLVAGLAGLATWLLVLKLLGSEEFEELVKHMKSRIMKSKVLVPEKVEM